MVLQGYVRVWRGDLHCAQILEPILLAIGDPALIAAQCMAALDPSFAERARDGDMFVVAGALDGADAAEAAVLGLQAVGIVAVVCASAEAAVVATATRAGLAVLEVPEAAAIIPENALLRLDLERGSLEAQGQRWASTPLSADGLAAVRRTQLLQTMRRIAEAEGLAE
jgi:3-isopropylmalate dehydratase small subunit